jgi:hypothetical protein
VGIGGCAEVACAGEAPDLGEGFLAGGTGLEEVDVWVFVSWFSRKGKGGGTCDGYFFTWFDGSGRMSGVN